MPDILFYLSAALIVMFAAMAVTMRHLLHAALALMGALFCTAALFILLHAEFVALVHVMVYIGGVVIFIIYTILLTARLGQEMPRISLFKHLAAGVAALALLGLLYLLWRHAGPELTAGHTPYTAANVSQGEPGSLRAIGVRLLSTAPDGFMLPFELVSVLLLAAMIGAISIARRPTKEEKESPP